MSEITDPELLKQLDAPSTEATSSSAIPPRVETQFKWGNEDDLARGIGQGLLDPFEGLAQFAEHIANHQIAPDALRNWARDFRNRAQSTKLGVGGEVLGNAAGLLIPGGAMGKAATWGGRAIQAATEGALGGMLQPVSGGKDSDYWATKKHQSELGALTGVAGPAIVGPVAHAASFLGRLGHLPSAALGALAHQVRPVKYGAGAGIYRGVNPTPADQQAAPEPDKPSQPPKDDDKPEPSPHDMPAPPPAVARPQMPPDFAERFGAARRQQQAEEGQ